VKNTGCEVHHFAIFSTIRLPPFYVLYPPQHSVLKNNRAYSKKVHIPLHHDGMRVYGM